MSFVLALAGGRLGPDGGGPQAPQGAGCSALIFGAGRCVRRRQTRSFATIPAWLAVIVGGAMPSDQNERASKGRRSSGVNPIGRRRVAEQTSSAIISRFLGALRMRRLHLLI
jgi:hypothetical protein